MTSKFLLAAVSAGLLFGAVHSAAAAEAAKGPKLTTAVQRALQDAQKAGAAKDYPTAAAAIDKAKAVSGLTPTDTLWINRIAMGIHIGMNDLAAAGVDAEAAADVDPSEIPDADKASVYKPALQLAMNAKHYDKAVKYAKLYQALTPPPPAADQALIVQAFYLGGDFASATAMAQKNIDAATAAGQKPQRSDLDIILATQVKQKDEAGAEKTLETLVHLRHAGRLESADGRVVDHQGHARHRLCLYGPADVPAEWRKNQAGGCLAGRFYRQPPGLLW